MDVLQAELKACKEKFGKDVELSKAEKGAPGAPFPVALTRYTPQPETAGAWDIDELPVRLVFNSPDAATTPVSVEVADYLGPQELIDKIEQAVEEEWKKMMKKKKKADTWQILAILEWVEAKFADLLMLCPQHVDSYVGCDFTGASMKRYVLVEPKDAEEEEEEEEVDEEEQERRHQEYVGREAARLEAQWEAQDAVASKKRAEAEQGFSEDGAKMVQLSKAEKAEMNKSRKEKSGHRWRKTPSKSHQATEEEKKEKAAKGKKK